MNHLGSFLNFLIIDKIATVGRRRQNRHCRCYDRAASSCEELALGKERLSTYFPLGASPRKKRMQFAQNFRACDGFEARRTVAVKLA